MKKRLEDKLREMAIDILNSRDTPDLKTLHTKSRDLYEQITIQLFLDKEAQEGKGPEITKEEQDVGSQSFEAREEEPVPVERSTHKDNLTEPLIEKIKDIVAQMPSETQKIDEMLEEILPSKTYKKNDLNDIVSKYSQMPTFERKEPSAPAVKRESNQKQEENTTGQGFIRQKSLNDQLNKGLAIGLNDRLAFVKHLFSDKSEDYNRVISQLTTFDSFEEARDFIQKMVKPDYNDWEGKEIYEERFLYILEKGYL